MDVRLEDGTVVTNVPDGMTQSALMARMGKPTPVAPKPFDTELSMGEKIANSLPDSVKKVIGLSEPYARPLVMGAADPVVGAMQLGANALGQGSSVNPAIQQKEQQYQESRGGDANSFDPLRMVGGMANMTSILPVAKIANAATTLGRIGQGAALGTAFGAASPVTQEDAYWGPKAIQTGMGLGLGAAIPGAWETAKMVGRATRNLAQSTTDSGVDKLVGRQWNLNAGPERDKIIELLQNYVPPASGAPLTAGQVAAPANRAEVAALQQLGENASPSVFRGEQGVNQVQADARHGLLDTLAQVGTNAKEDTLSALRARTLPDREQALKNANIAGILAPQLEADASRFSDAAASKVQDVRRMAGAADRAENMGMEFGRRSPATALGAPTGMPSAGKQYSYGQELANRAENVSQQSADSSLSLGEAARLAKLKADSIAGEGFLPLKTDQLTNPLDKLLTTPGPEASDMMQKSIGAVNAKFKELSKDGIIDARNLDTIRKELGTTIKDAIMKPDGSWDSKWAAGQEIQIKKSIDAAINKAAGNDQYTQHLADYGQGMKAVNDITIGRELEKALVSGTGAEREASFMNAVKNATQSPDMLRKGGAARFGNIDEAMTPRGQEVKNKLMQELAAQRNFEDLAQGGMSNAVKNVGVGMPEVMPTGMFNPKLSVARALINRFIGGEHGKVLQRSGEASVDPQLIAKLMENAKPFERQNLVDMLMRYQGAQQGQPNRN